MAVTVRFPGAKAVRSPELLMNAAPAGLTAQRAEPVTSAVVPSVIKPVAVYCCVPVTGTVPFRGAIVMLASVLGLGSTVIWNAACKFSIEAVMTTFPEDLVVINPLLLTSATFWSDVLQLL